MSRRWGRWSLTAAFLLGLLPLSGPASSAMGQTPAPVSGTQATTDGPVPPAGPASIGPPPDTGVVQPPPPTIPSVASVPVQLPVPLPGLAPGAPFQLQPIASLSASYTDNFDLSGGDGRDNLRTALSVGGQLSINFPLTKGFASYTLTLADDTANDVLANFHSLAAAVRWEATPRLTLTVGDTFTRSDAPAQADALHLRTERRLFTSNTLSLASEYRLDRFEVQPFYRLATFEEDEGDSTVAHTAGLTLGAAVGATNRVTAGYEFLHSDTSDEGTITGHRVQVTVVRQLTALASAGVTASHATRTVSEADSDGDFQVSGARLFGSYGIPGRWSAGGSLGVSRVSEGVEPWIVSGSITLSYRFARGIVTLAAERGFSETFASGENFGVVKTQGVTATASYALTPLLTSTGQAFYRENEGTGLAGSRRGRVQDAWGVGAGIVYRARRWLSIGLDYSFTNQGPSLETTAGAGQGRIIENRATLSLTLAF